MRVNRKALLIGILVTVFLSAAVLLVKEEPLKPFALSPDGKYIVKGEGNKIELWTVEGEKVWERTLYYYPDYYRVAALDFQEDVILVACEIPGARSLPLFYSIDVNGDWLKVSKGVYYFQDEHITDFYSSYDGSLICFRTNKTGWYKILLYFDVGTPWNSIDAAVTYDAGWGNFGSGVWVEYFQDNLQEWWWRTNYISTHVPSGGYTPRYIENNIIVLPYQEKTLLYRNISGSLIKIAEIPEGGTAVSASRKEFFALWNENRVSLYRWTEKLYEWNHSGITDVLLSPHGDSMVVVADRTYFFRNENIPYYSTDVLFDELRLGGDYALGVIGNNIRQLFLRFGPPETEMTITEGRVTLRWSPVPYAVSYIVQLSDKPTFETENKIVEDNWTTWDLKPGTYWWRVAPIAEDGTIGAWSDPLKIEVLAPTVPAPFLAVAPVTAPPSLLDPMVLLVFLLLLIVLAYTFILVWRKD